MTRASKSMLMEYFSKPISRSDFDYLNKSNGVSVERCELFIDIVITLTLYVYNTYLGDDVMLTDNDRRSHFRWCWDKTTSDFDRENIFLKKSGEHLPYFNGYYDAVFYDSNIKNKKLLKSMIEFWLDMFTLETKTQLKYEVFIESYKLLDNALIEEKNRNTCFLK